MAFVTNSAPATPDSIATASSKWMQLIAIQMHPQVSQAGAEQAPPLTMVPK
jgi:hypothetical protein